MVIIFSFEVDVLLYTRKLRSVCTLSPILSCPLLSSVQFCPVMMSTPLLLPHILSCPLSSHGVSYLILYSALLFCYPIPCSDLVYSPLLTSTLLCFLLLSCPLFPLITCSLFSPLLMFPLTSDSSPLLYNVSLSLVCSSTCLLLYSHTPHTTPCFILLDKICT